MIRLGFIIFPPREYFLFYPEMKNENKCFAPMLRESKIDPFLSVSYSHYQGKNRSNIYQSWPALPGSQSTSEHKNKFRKSKLKIESNQMEN